MDLWEEIMKIILVLMGLFIFAVSAMAIPMNDSKITYDDSIIISDTTEFYNSVNGYYRKCEVMPFPNQVTNVTPEPSTILMVVAGLGVIGLAVKRGWENVKQWD
jgi:hypothetical protein